jgi:rhamnogalacturonan endolyase
MTAWRASTFTVGTSATSDFPMALFKAVNSPVTIRFVLDAGVAGAATLRIATTLAFGGARPAAKVNSWSAAAPGAPTKVDGRGVTRGAYRGLGEVYDVVVPAGTLVKGENTVVISVSSGSSGDTFLSPNFVSFDIYHSQTWENIPTRQYWLQLLTSLGFRSLIASNYSQTSVNVFAVAVQ